MPQCPAYALGAKEPAGVWAGTTAEQRKAMRLLPGQRGWTPRGGMVALRCRQAVRRGADEAGHCRRQDYPTGQNPPRAVQAGATAMAQGASRMTADITGTPARRQALVLYGVRTRRRTRSGAS